MKITREETLVTEVILSIECDSDDVEPYLDWAYRRLVNKVRIPGFRMGKAPRSILEQTVGREHLLHEALERAVNGLVDKAVEQESLEPYVLPMVDVTGFDPLSLKATVPLEPIVSLGDYRSLRIDRRPINVGEEQVNEVLERLRVEAAPWEPVDRPVQFQDQITIDVMGTVDGRTVVDNKGIDYIPSMENKLPLPGFSVMIEGAKKGDSKTFNLPVPSENEDSEISGKECRFQVVISEVKQKVLPDLDNEFAKGVGEGYDNLEALKESVLENLTSTAEREVDQELYDEALDQVTQGAEVEFAEVLVDRQLDHIWHERSQAMQAQRMDMDTYLQQIGKSEEEVKEEMRPGTRERLVRSLILEKLTEEENIVVTPEDVDKQIEEIVTASGTSDESVRQTVSSEGFRHSVESTLNTRKTLERLAQIVQRHETEDEPSSEEYEEDGEEEINEDTEQGGSN